jgi:hypothetical protein
MAITIVYQGWLTNASPTRKKDLTALLTPSRFFYRPKKHVIVEKIRLDALSYGHHVNIRVWMHYKKINKEDLTAKYSFLGVIKAVYFEVFKLDEYSHTMQYIHIDNLDLLEKLMLHCHHYCIIEITYGASEFDVIAHDLERILLKN